MSRLSRALWCLVPIRASFRPDGSMTPFGRWSFHRIVRKLPKRDFITAAEQRDIAAENALIHAQHIARGLFDESYPYTVEYRHEPPAITAAQPTEYRCPVHGDTFVTVNYELPTIVCLTCGQPVEEVKPIQTDRPAP